MMPMCKTCKHKAKEKGYISLICLSCCYEYGCASEEEGLEMDYPKSSKYKEANEDDS